MSMEGGKYVEVEPGVELFVQDVGNGDPIVFIPGWTFTTEVFSKQVEHFKKTNRVLVIDPRSHGKSSITMHGNDYVTHGLDLAKIIGVLGLKDFTLLGWSFGCLTIWEYIRQQGTKNIKSAVFVDLSPKPLSNDHKKDWVEGPLDEIAAAYTYLRNRKKQREFIAAYATDVMVQRQLSQSELNWLVEQSMNTPHFIAANLFSAGMFSDYREEAKKASESFPTLTVIAEHWADIAENYTKQLTPATSTEVLGGHLMFWEQDQKFNQILEEFLQSK